MTKEELDDMERDLEQDTIIEFDEDDPEFEMLIKKYQGG